MFCLQRAVVFLYHEFRHITHHLSIAIHLGLLSETLVQDKVVVALEGMTIDTRIVVTMIGNKLL